MALSPTYPLRAARLSLRPLGLPDVPALVFYRSLPEVCRYVPFEPMTAEAVATRVGGLWSSTTLGKEGDALILGVELNETRELVGDVMLRWASAEHSCGEIGYVLSPAHTGHGYATEAAHAMLHLAFDEMRWHRVTARIDPRNPASIGVVKRLGMRQEAHLVENEWFKGGWSDELDFALLKAEWQSQRRAGCPACPH